MAKATKSYVMEIYVLCNGNNITEMAISYIDMVLVEYLQQ